MGAVAVADASANKVATDPIEWKVGLLSYHFGFLDGVALPDDECEMSYVSECAREWGREE